MCDEITYFVDADWVDVNEITNASKSFDTLKAARKYADEIWEQGARINGIYKESPMGSKRIE